MWTWEYFANWDLETPEQPLTESEAHERDEELEPYVVVVKQDGQPRYVVDSGAIPSATASFIWTKIGKRSVWISIPSWIRWAMTFCFWSQL
jgi:hypothetical protein